MVVPSVVNIILMLRQIGARPTYCLSGILSFLRLSRAASIPFLRGSCVEFITDWVSSGVRVLPCPHPIENRSTVSAIIFMGGGVKPTKKGAVYYLPLALDKDQTLHSAVMRNRNNPSLNPPHQFVKI